MEFVVFKSGEHFHKDVAAKGYPGGPQTRHIGAPERYPCLGVVHLSDDHNTYYWSFLYKIVRFSETY
jgi:hypothetical protein